MKNLIILAVLLSGAIGLYSCGEDYSPNSRCFGEVIKIALPLSEEDVENLIHMEFYYSDQYEYNDEGKRRLINPKHLVLPHKRIVSLSSGMFKYDVVYNFVIASIKTDSGTRLMFTPVGEFEICRR